MVLEHQLRCLDALVAEGKRIAKRMRLDVVVMRVRGQETARADRLRPRAGVDRDGGETEAGEPYIVMEYVEGRPLDVWLAQDAPSAATRLDLFLTAASAVARTSAISRSSSS